MKKIALSLLAITGMIFASVALANAASGYYSAPSSKTASSLKGAKSTPTDITIINASNNWITALVADFRKPIAPGDNGHINHDTYYGDSYVYLFDPANNVFYNPYIQGPFCHLAVVTVYGGPGSYRVNVDRSLC